MAKCIYTRTDVFRLCERLEGLGATRFLDALSRDNLDETGATIRMRRGGRVG